MDKISDRQTNLIPLNLDLETKKTLQKPEETKQAAEDFESMLTRQMINAMWETIPKDGLLTGSSEEQFYRDIFSEQLANEISKGHGLGIKEVVEKELKSREKKHS